MARRRTLILSILLAASWLGAVCGDAPSAAPERGIRSRAAERTAPPASAPLVAVLCYHDISDGRDPKGYAVSAEELRGQIRRSREAGWTFIPLARLLALRDRPAELPDRAMVLTFDDGYRSFIEKALPVLREEGVTATLAVVGSFVDSPPPGLPPLMTWDEIRKVDRSGLVEIASHTHALHRYETSNPYRDTGPSVSTRRYLLDAARYEDRDEYRRRIRDDLRTSRRRLREELGHDVAVLAWPYGEHNEMARAIAADAGFSATLGLDGTDVRPEDLRAGYVPRVIVSRGARIGGSDLSWLYPSRRPVRAAQVDLDAVHDPDPAAFARKVDRTVEAVRSIGATHVFLQACPDPAGDGVLEAAWFANHQVPVRADIWSMVAAKLSHAGLSVWIRAPSMNLSWEWAKHPEWRIPFRRGRKEKGPDPWYRRLSPELRESRRAAVDFFTDIAVYLPIEGILFDDDAYMLPGERLRGSGDGRPEAKEAAIRERLEEIKAAVLAWRPNCRFARNMYAPAAEGDGVHPGFSQDPGRFLRDYDLTVVMAYARMEGREKDPGGWAEALFRRIAAAWVPPAGQGSWAPPAMLKFQAYDWRAEAWVPGEELLAMAAGARRAMAVDLGVYPVIEGKGNIPAGFLGAPIPASGRSEPHP